LGLRFNFLSEDGLVDFIKTIFLNNTNSPKKLEEIFIKNNSINELGLFALKRSFDNLNIKKLNIDLFDKIKYLDQEKLDRTVWLHPTVSTRHEIKTFFEDYQKCGIVTDIRIRSGPKWPNRVKEANKFVMVEFADPTSIERALKIAARKKALIGLKKFRIYKAGTGTYIY